MSICSKILSQLKKHPQAQPFLDPVDAKKLGIPHYFEVVKDPMDLSTIESHLRSGDYHSPNQFYADLDKIWYNSYSYNDKSSRIYKSTVEMERYYKKLLSDYGVGPQHKKVVKSKSKPVDSL